MSLSFVKSAVLSSTDGISHNEETIIDNRETQSLRASSGAAGGHQPLFEQLRANKDAEQERDDEFQKSLRGIRPLDEEDCAHLDAVERRKMEQEDAVRSGVEWEVAMFRAAKKDRGLIQTIVEEEGEDRGTTRQGGKDSAIASMTGEALGDEVGANAIEGTQSIIAARKDNSNNTMARIVPKFTIKKKRKRVPEESGGEIHNADITKSNGDDSCDTKECSETCVDAGVMNNESKSSTITATTNNADDKDEDGGGLLGLGCYGSDSD